MKKYLIVFSALVLISCSATKFVPLPPTQADADRASAKFPGLTVQELSVGKMKYEAECGNCHGLKNPTRYSEEKWRVTVPKMAEKANKKAKKEVVDAEGQEAILKYVIAMSSR